MKKIAKAKAGTSLGMKSVKAGYDSNPGVTRADIISAAKMKTGKAKYGAKVAAKKPIKKAQDGLKAIALPQVTKQAKSLRPMEIALGDDRKMSIDTVGYKSPATMRNETFNYSVSDKSGKNIRQGKLQSGPGESRVDIVSRMAKDLDSGKMKRPTFKKGGKVLAKKPIKKAQNGEKTKMVVDGKEYVEGSMLDEAVVTGKPIKSLKDRVKLVKDKVKSIGDGLGLNRSYKPKPAKRSVQSVKTYRQKGSGPGSGLMKLKQRITRRYKEGGEVEMAKKGTSVKKSMGKCKMGC
jgi:hypothetical protein